MPSLESIPRHEGNDDVAFITGATGFIGGHLLKAFIQSGRFSKYICLVRRSGRENPTERLRKGLMDKGLTESEWKASLVEVCEGDIYLPEMGLTTQEYESFSEEVGHFFHFAASMNWVAPFNSDARANLSALREVIRFSSLRSKTKLHYASSMGIWTILHHTSGSIAEDDIHELPGELPGGYFQSKWVAEKMLMKARASGLPVNVYRIGDVKGHSATGHGDPQNFGNIVMQYFLECGVCVENDRPEFNFIPVDYLAKSINVLTMQFSNQTFQFSNPELISFSDIGHVGKSIGRHLEWISMKEWISHLLVSRHPSAPLLRAIFKPFAPSTGEAPVSFYEIGYRMFTRKHDMQNTIHGLKGSGVQCPAMLSDDVLRRYLNHFQGALV